MKPFYDLVNRVRADPRRIVLAEGEDPRIIAAAKRSLGEGIARITLLGRENVIRERLADIGRVGRSPLPVETIDPAASNRLDEYGERLYELRRHKGMTPDQARNRIREPLFYAAMMVHLGDADGSVAGAHYTTADTVRAAIQVIGLRQGCKLVSSFFIMMLCEPFHDLKGALILADCGLVIDPNAAELAQIAVDSADSARTLLAMEPRVAMLTFSTKGSSQHAMVDKVIEATENVRRLRPDMKVEGEVQLDAAIVPEISERKAPGSPVGGRANVLIFPDLQSGNISYKLLERLAKAKAIGPILQGLRKPANDLSRGCNADDVYRVIAVTAAQAQAASQ